MSTLVFKASDTRPSIDFTYEFLDGTSALFRYHKMNTAQIDESISMDKTTEKDPMAVVRMGNEYTKKILEENLSAQGGEQEKTKLLKELQEMGNLYAFHRMLVDSIEAYEKETEAAREKK